MARDWIAEHDARVAWLKAHLKKAEHGMESEYRVDLADVVRMRMFRQPRSTRHWALVAHRPEENQRYRAIGVLFNIEGDRDRESFSSREHVLSWIAIRWDYAVDAAMKAEVPA